MNTDKISLSVQNLSVRLRGKDILRGDGLSFSLREGEIAGLLGPNGSGKSTLLRAITGLVPRGGGVVRFGDEAPGRFPNPRERALLCAYVAQNEQFTAAYTVIESVMMGRYPHISRFGSYRAADYELASDALKRVDLGGFENRRVTALSGGEAARVVIARALAQATPVLLLDEPTAALDPRHAMMVSRLLRDLASEGKAILVAMHEVNLALGCTDRILFLRGGRLVSDTAADAVDEKLLRSVYGISWEIWKLGSSGRRFVLPIEEEAAE